MPSRLANFFGGVVGKGPQKVLKIRTKLTKRVAKQGSKSHRDALVMVVGVVFSSLLVLHSGKVINFERV